MLIQNARIQGDATQDLRCGAGQVQEIASHLAPIPGEPILDAAGGALLPGLHDHHIHLLSLAASLVSVPCGPPAVDSRADLAEALAQADPVEGWIRGTGYHESVAGELDRAVLDGLRSDVAVRIQHRSGSMWFLNSRGLEVLGPAPSDAGPSTPFSDRTRGRFFREDPWLRERLPHSPPDLGRVGRLLAKRGVTGVTDATPHNGPDEWALIAAAQKQGLLPQRVEMMGGLDLLASESGAPLGRAQHKILLDEPALPDLDALSARIREAHRAGRGVAIHTVTRTEIHFALAALQAAQPHPADRLEHASVAPEEVIERVRDLGITIVTQPQFVYERGDAYRRDVAATDQPHLYRLRSWRSAGVALAAGTDAPFGEADPWLAMRAAVDRRSRGGESLGPDESLSPEEALALFTSDPRAPGRRARQVAVGQPADLCLLHVPWSQARTRLERGVVRATICRGVPVDLNQSS